MSADKDPLEGVLDSFSRDKPIDWEAVSKDAGPEHESRIEALRHLSSIASFNRSLQRGGRPSSRDPKVRGREIPDRWGNLLVLERISSTPRSDLLRAWDPGRSCDVALRLFVPSPTGKSTLRPAVERSLGIRHPNLATLFGVEQHDGRTGIWMELVDGVPLARRVDGHGPLNPAEVTRVGIEIGSALAVLHAAGAVHGRITAANVLFDPSNRARLTEPEILERTDPTESIASSVDADLCALGLVLWFAVTGRSSFARHEADLSTLPPTLRDTLKRAIDPTPDSQIQSAQELVESLAAGSPGVPPGSALTRLGDRLRRFRERRSKGA